MGVIQCCWGGGGGVGWGGGGGGVEWWSEVSGEGGKEGKARLTVCKVYIFLKATTNTIQKMKNAEIQKFRNPKIRYFWKSEKPSKIRSF